MSVTEKMNNIASPKKTIVLYNVKHQQQNGEGSLESKRLELSRLWHLDWVHTYLKTKINNNNFNTIFEEPILLTQNSIEVNCAEIIEENFKKDVILHNNSILKKYWNERDKFFCFGISGLKTIENPNTKENEFGILFKNSGIAHNIALLSTEFWRSLSPPNDETYILFGN